MDHIGKSLGSDFNHRLTSDFPSYEHSIAWECAEYFKEPYNVWVRYVKQSKLYPGAIKHELDVLKTKHFRPTDKVKMFMVTLGIKRVT